VSWMQSLRKALNLDKPQPLAPVVIETQKKLEELESSQAPLKEALDKTRYYPITGSIRDRPHTGKRRAKGAH
jgi:hypothetical protein